MNTCFILRIQAEGMPSFVGIFGFAYQADEWAQKNIKTGSWEILPVRDKSVVGPQ